MLTAILTKKIKRRHKLSESEMKGGTSVLTLQKLRKLHKGISQTTLYQLIRQLLWTGKIPRMIQMTKIHWKSKKIWIYL